MLASRTYVRTTNRSDVPPHRFIQAKGKYDVASEFVDQPRKEIKAVFEFAAANTDAAL